MSENHDEFSVRNRFRRFLLVGIGRIIITRIISLLYVIYVTAKIPSEINDTMIFLALTQIIILQTASMGINYSLTRQTIILKLHSKQVYAIGLSVLTFSIPFITIAGVIVAVFANLSIQQVILYVFGLILGEIIEIVVAIKNAFIDSDFALILRSIYSIMNSISIPFFFNILANLNSILIAWNVAYIIVILVAGKTVIKILIKSRITYKETKSVIKFGLPVYYAAIFALVVQNVDAILLFIFYKQGETSLYYWSIKIATIVREIFLASITGVLPLLSKIYSRGDKEYYYKILSSITKVILILSVIFYAAIIYQTKFLNDLLLGQYSSGYILTRIALSGFMFDGIATILYSAYGAEGRRKTMSLISASGNVVRLIAILAFSVYGALGFAVARTIHRTYLGIVYLIKRRNELRIRQDYMRVFIFSIIVMVAAWILPPGTELLIITASIAFALIIICLLFILKPLTNTDWEILEKVMGKRLSKKVHILRKLVVN